MTTICISATSFRRLNPYFLTVHDLVREARKRGILCQGREAPSLCDRTHDDAEATPELITVHGREKDGYRALIIKDGTSIRVRSRNDKDLMPMYPAVAAAGRRLQAEQAVIDGEIVAIDEQGRSSFQALQHRGTHPDHTIVFYAFDLLHLNGQSTTALPLKARRTKLARVIDKSGLLLSLELPGSAADIVSTVRAMQLEGVVAKRAR